MRCGAGQPRVAFSSMGARTSSAKQKSFRRVAAPELVETMDSTAARTARALVHSTKRTLSIRVLLQAQRAVCLQATSQH